MSAQHISFWTDHEAWLQTRFLQVKSKAAVMRHCSPLILRRAKYLDTNSSLICTRASAFCRRFKFRSAESRSLETCTCGSAVRSDTMEAILGQDPALKAVRSSQAHHDKVSGARKRMPLMHKIPTRPCMRQLHQVHVPTLSAIV